MEQKEEFKGRRANEIGPVGQRAARNLKNLRERRGLRQDELSDAVTRLGRPMPRSAISKTEDATRRVDLDDLVALAIALRITPDRLLLTATATDEFVELAPEVRVSELYAWMWATGEEPLPRGCDAPKLQIVIESDRERWFKQENQPHHPPDAPAGVLLREHPDIVQALASVLHAAAERGIDVGQLQYGLQTLHFTGYSGYIPWKKPSVEADDDNGQG